jgi:hypothetical protein
MIKVELAGDVCLVEPQGALTKDDFAAIAAVVDPVIESDGQLGGLIIKTREFPGWEGFGDMVEHMRFVRGHHQHINKIALVTDAKVSDLFPSIANHFVKAEVKHFAFDDYENALAWLS